MKKLFTLFLFLLSMTAGRLQAQTAQSLSAWGSNSSGQLGDGTTTNKVTPAQVGVDKNWSTLAAGNFHSLAIKKDGTLWAWGSNTNGQLGDGTTTNKNTPVKVGTATNWAAITAGNFHSLAVKNDGTLWAWGINSSGQLGDGTTTNKNTPVQVGNDNNWAAVSAGANHSIAIKKDGTLWTWGNNAASQLGDGTTTNRNTPVQVGNDNNWAAVSAGTYHNLGIKKDGTLWAWGYNNVGQLGDGTTALKNTPVKVGNDNNWAAVTAGGLHSLAKKVDGTLWAWGSNAYGQLGDGSTTNKNTPIRVGADNNWTAVEVGYNHSLAIKNDSTLWAWGYNANGELGDGTTTNKNIPVKVGTATNWATVEAGPSHNLALSVVFLSNNAELSNLALSAGTLSPVFAPGTLSYSATVGNMVSSLTTTPTVADAKAIVTVNGQQVASGSASSAISLNVGSNQIDVVVTAEDGHTQKTYSIHVTRAENTAPLLSAIGNKTVNELTALTFTAAATDEDAGQAVTYSLIGAPIGATINATTGDFSWTPTEEQGPANFTFKVRATDNGTPALFTEEEITVTVNEVNEAPVLTEIGNKTVNELATLTFTAAATDADLPAQTLRYSLTDAPEGASINAATGVFSWTPTEAQDGTYTFTVKVSDGTATDEEAITVTVNEVNEAPVITSVPETTAMVDSLYSYHIIATDTDLPANTLTYTASTLPSWLSLNSTTMVLSGRPDNSQVGEHQVKLSVSDGSITVEQEFVIMVSTITSARAKDLKKNQVLVFPNPTAGQVSIAIGNINTSKDMALRLTSVEGRTMLNTTGQLEMVNKQLNDHLSDAPAGMYMLQLVVDKEIHLVKIVKQ